MACAWQLEQFGVTPDIYERYSHVGGSYKHVGAHLNIITRPITDIIQFLHVQYGLVLAPLNEITQITMHAPTITRMINGQHGYFITRGPTPNSLENQLLSKLNTPPLYHTTGDYRKLAQEYDYLVVADGEDTTPKELGCWQTLLSPWLVGATIVGNFDPHEIIMWINRVYCKTGYAYLCPFNSTQASVALVVPRITREEASHFWETFWRLERLQTKYDIIETFQQHHKSGYTYPHRVENIYFAGNAAGAIEPFLGFGVVFSLVSGILVARSIVTGSDYEKELEFVLQIGRSSIEYRSVFDTLTNKDMDRLVRVISAPVVRNLGYQTNINFFAGGARLVHLLENLCMRW